MLALPAFAGELPGPPDAVGLIRYSTVPKAGAAVCTGTLVAPDLVLTAAHCLFDARTGAAIPNVRFDAGWDGTRAVASGRGMALPDAGPVPVGDARDAALLRLDRPMASVTPVPFAAEAADPLTLRAYSRAGQDAPAVSLVCPTVRRVGDLSYHLCGVVSGNSGAPLLALADGRWALAAIVIARVGGALALATRPDGAVLGAMTDGAR